MRRLAVDQYARKGDQVRITTDASPYGMGGVIEVNGSIIARFAEPITEDDIRFNDLSRPPTSADQQVLEALAMLLALRLWPRHWQTGRCNLAVRADNMAALRSLPKCSPRPSVSG